MRVYLCAGFGEPLSLEDWSLISDLGFDGIRTDVRKEGDAGGLVANTTAANREGLFIAPVDVPLVDETLAVVEAIATAAKVSRAPDLVAIEVGNEPDRSGRWRHDASGFGRLVAVAAELAWSILPGIQIVSGGIGTLSREALGWLAAAAPFFPLEVAVGFHPYRSTPPGVPRQGFSSRRHEFQALAAIAAGRQTWCTEVGWHTAPRNRDFPLCFTNTRYADGEVASFLRSELRLLRDEGLAEAACIYQLQDGPHWRTESEDAFGIRRVDGSLKPAAYVAREWRS